MERRKIKETALQILKDQIDSPVLGLKHYTETPDIDSDRVELYEEFRVGDTLYAVWKQEQEQPKVAKREEINYVR